MRQPGMIAATMMAAAAMLGGARQSAQEVHAIKPDKTPDPVYVDYAPQIHHGGSPINGARKPNQRQMRKRARALGTTVRALKYGNR